MGPNLPRRQRGRDERVLPRDLVDREPEEVALRHPQEEAVDGLRILPRERLPDGVRALGQARGRVHPDLAPLEHALDLGHQLADERRPPRRPGERPRRAGVRDREQVQGRQALGVADPGGDVVHELLGLEVPARGDVGEQEVLGDEERGELPGPVGQPHPRERLARDPRPEGHVARAPGLADVVQQGPQPERVGVANRGDRLGHQRVDLALAGEQPVHPVQRGEQVRVDREAMVRIALGAAPDGGPRREVADEQADAVERVERADPARSGREQREERVANAVRPLDRVRDRHGRDQVQRRRPHHAARAGDLDERAEHALGGRVHLRRLRRRPQITVEDGAGDVLHLAGVLEHAAHQPVHGREARLVLEAEVPRHLRLLLEHDAVVRPPGLEVQRAANPLEELVRGVDGLALRGSQQPRVLERLADRRLEPAEELDVAEPARALLQVRLQQPRDRAVPREARLGVLAQGLRERPRVGPDGSRDAAQRVDPRDRVAGDRPAVEHGRARVQALRREVLALLRRPHAVPDAQARVPERIEEALGQLGDVLVVAAVVDDQQVEVGQRRQPPPPVPAERHERRPSRRLGALVQRHEAGVDELRPPGGRPPPVMAGRVRALERPELLEQALDRGGTLGRGSHGLRGRRGPSRRSGCGRPARSARSRSCRRRSCPSGRPW